MVRDVLVGLAVALAGLAVFASDLDLGWLSARLVGGILMGLGAVLTAGPLLSARRRRGPRE